MFSIKGQIVFAGHSYKVTVTKVVHFSSVCGGIYNSLQMLATIPSLQEIQKQAKEQIYPRGCSLLIDYMANDDGM